MFEPGIPRLLLMVTPWLLMEVKDQHLGCLLVVMIPGRLCHKHQDRIQRTHSILAILVILQDCPAPL